MPGRRIALALLAASAVGAGALPAAPAAAAVCAGIDTPVSASSLPDARAAVLCLVNAERTARGLAALTPDDQLALAAQRHTDDMVARDFFSHTAPAPAPYGTDPGARITAAGYDWWAYGENIASGYLTPRDAMEGWMASPGHCRNILDPGLTQIGVGVAATAATLGGQSGGTWTQDFGRPAHAAAPSSDTGAQDGCPYGELLGVTAIAASAPGTLQAVTAPGAPTATQGGPADAPAPAAPAPAAPSLALSTAVLARALHRVGGRLVAGGALPVPDGTMVRVTIRHRHHVIRRLRLRVRHGRLRLRLRLPRHHQRYRVSLSVGSQHATRTILTR